MKKHDIADLYLNTWAHNILFRKNMRYIEDIDIDNLEQYKGIGPALAKQIRDRVAMFYNKQNNIEIVENTTDNKIMILYSRYENQLQKIYREIGKSMCNKGTYDPDIMKEAVDIELKLSLLNDLLKGE